MHISTAIIKDVMNYFMYLCDSSPCKRPLKSGRESFTNEISLF